MTSNDAIGSGYFGQRRVGCKLLRFHRKIPPSRLTAVAVRGLSRAIEGTLIYLILLPDFGV
jgi:hypothetical protein